MLKKLVPLLTPFACCAALTAACRPAQAPPRLPSPRLAWDGVQAVQITLSGREPATEQVVVHPGLDGAIFVLWTDTEGYTNQNRFTQNSEDTGVQQRVLGQPLPASTTLRTPGGAELPLLAVQTPSTTGTVMAMHTSSIHDYGVGSQNGTVIPNGTEALLAGVLDPVPGGEPGSPELFLSRLVAQAPEGTVSRTAPPLDGDTVYSMGRRYGPPSSEGFLAVGAGIVPPEGGLLLGFQQASRAQVWRFDASYNVMQRVALEPDVWRQVRGVAHGEHGRIYVCTQHPTGQNFEVHRFNAALEFEARWRGQALGVVRGRPMGGCAVGPGGDLFVSLGLAGYGPAEHAQDVDVTLHRFSGRATGSTLTPNLSRTFRTNGKESGISAPVFIGNHGYVGGVTEANWGQATSPVVGRKKVFLFRFQRHDLHITRVSVESEPFPAEGFEPVPVER